MFWDQFVEVGMITLLQSVWSRSSIETSFHFLLFSALQIMMSGCFAMCVKDQGCLVSNLYRYDDYHTVVMDRLHTERCNQFWSCRSLAREGTTLE